MCRLAQRLSHGTRAPTVATGTTCRLSAGLRLHLCGVIVAWTTRLVSLALHCFLHWSSASKFLSLFFMGPGCYWACSLVSVQTMISRQPHRLRNVWNEQTQMSRHGTLAHNGLQGPAHDSRLTLTMHPRGSVAGSQVLFSRIYFSGFPDC